MRQILRGATVIDGTGAAARRADVVVDGDHIAAVGDGVMEGDEEIDLSGLVLAPGFIDIHTHYDAQVLWDPDLTPSSWHGVTSVVMGNCGFGIAPAQPAHHDHLLHVLESVEGMAIGALQEGVRWGFESFGEYLGHVTRAGTRLNVGFLVPHTALRHYVMGRAADRVASPEETAAMAALVSEAVDAGALGFSTSRSTSHVDMEGTPVASRWAATEEVFALASALNGRGIVQLTAGPDFYVDECAALAEHASVPVTWTAFLTGRPEAERGQPDEVLARTRALGAPVWPQFACRPIVFQLVLTEPFPFMATPVADVDRRGDRTAFEVLMAAPATQRQQLYGDAEWRARARAEIEPVWKARWPKMHVQETHVHPELVGVPLSELAARRRAHPFDLLLDLAIEEQLRTRFQVVLMNDDESQLADMLRDPAALLGLSDAGAHASQLCDACYSTYLLAHWVRDRQALSLEQAVWRLTGHPAEVFRVSGRGQLSAGYAADLVAFDPDTVGPGDLERVDDLPAGGDRLITRSTGIEHVWVNGRRIRRDGSDVGGALPGRLVTGR